jgi:ribosomal protein S18 acetylase RimI-like enzyme
VPFVVRRVTAAETRPLRQRILRPHQRVEQLVFAHDDDVETLHAAAFVGEVIVGTATIHPEPMPGDPSRRAWRLRGMATAPEVRRQGCGAALVDACMVHAVTRGGEIVWCNARATAAPFYDALGFERHGEPFELPEIGPHYLMTKRIV